MEHPTPHDPELQPKGVEVHTTIGQLVLHWYNTTIRVFPDEQFNHVEYVDEDGDVRGLQASQHLMDTLFELDFPMYSLPYVDASTFEWTVKTLAKDIRRLDTEELTEVIRGAEE